MYGEAKLTSLFQEVDEVGESRVVGNETHFGKGRFDLQIGVGRYDR